MISYLGVTIDEIVQTFENTFAFSDDRSDRLFEEVVEVSEASEDEEEGEELSADADEDFEDMEDLEDDEIEDVFVDDEGNLRALGQTVAFAAEAAIGFLTDYIVTDDIDEEWLTLDQARGALLAFRIILPSLDEIPEAEAAYSFTISRDLETGFPNQISMKTLSIEAGETESLTFSASSYEGVISDRTALSELIETSGIPEGERELLDSLISEAVFTLADEQCEIVFDVRSFCKEIADLALQHKNAPADEESPAETPSH